MLDVEEKIYPQVSDIVSSKTTDTVWSKNVLNSPFHAF
jgi:hypothetical protein